MTRLYFISLLMLFSLVAKGQTNLPNTSIRGFYYIAVPATNNRIHEVNTITGTDQVVFDIGNNLGHGLAIGKVLGSNNPTQTYYLVGPYPNMTYHYIDPITLQMVNTGHRASNVNPTIGNRYLYNLANLSVYRYDGTRDDTLIKVLNPSIDGINFVVDIFADCEDNFYLLNNTHLNKYDSSGNMIQQWNRVPAGIPAAGIAIVDDTLYTGGGNTVTVYHLQGSNANYIRTFSVPGQINDMANYRTGPSENVTIVADSQGCGNLYTIRSIIPNNITNTTYTWFLNGSILTGYTTPTIQRNFTAGDLIQLKVDYTGFCESLSYSNIIAIDSISNRTYVIIDTAICFGASFDGYTQSGTYIDTFATANCDSIRRLELTVRPMPVVMETITHCNPVLPVIWNGQTVSQAGTFTLVDTSAQVRTGCDSVTVLTLNIIFSDTTHLYDTTCYLRDGYRWHNNRYFASGTYFHTLTAGNGCDSILVLHLSMDAAPTADTTRLANCLSVTFNGQEYRKDTAIVQTYRNINQCDSHYTVTQITIHRAYTINYEKTVCRGEAFTVNGIEYRQEGTYIQPYTSMAGCDSNIRITLRISEFPEYALTVTPEQPPYCLGDRVTVAAPEDYVYNWMGYPVDSTGNNTQVFRLDAIHNAFPFTIKNEFNCEVADTLVLEAEKCCRIAFPTAFTPNDDGLNDDFGPMPLSAVNDYYNLSIFNRWGQKVFTSTHINNRWNGHIKGEDAATDVYYYYLEYTCYDGKKYVLKGDVTLLR